ncbi:hypothetical protein WK13_34985 [Burkholderia ubonensis]|uniref:hypothetical protein n=1 Tax=Burkholderia ubonensis TaxID=101571 RepID=UPI000755CC41|nr:hypothetical protein [Burkholderia ubonensis]KVR21746.1 hypothetical protein WK13_34985 [Burkholderia ubonensis]
MLSTYQKIQKVSQLRPGDVTEWELGFITNLADKAERAANAGQVTAFSDKQIDRLDGLYNKHFPDGKE